MNLNKDKVIDSLNKIYEKLQKFATSYKLPSDWLDILENDGYAALLE